MNERNYNIDLMKGILIISVVLGHVLLGSTRDNFIRYLIYSIHMPLFISISGYLMNLDKLGGMNLISLVKKYFFRLLIPWVIAVNVYFTANNILDWKISGIELSRDLVIEYAKAYVNPYIHLWYVLGLMTYVLLTWLLVKTANLFLTDQKHIYMILGVFGAIISIIGFYYRVPSIKLHYYVFFVFGIMSKKMMSGMACNRRGLIGKILSGCLVLLLIARIVLYFTDLEIADVGSPYIYILNIPLLFMAAIWFENKALPRCRFLEFLGRESLGIYLWHMLGKQWTFHVVGKENVPAYYTVNVLLICLGLILLMFGKRLKFVNRYLLGNADR